MILRISVSSLEKSGQTPPMTGFSSCAQHIVLIRAMLSHPVPGGKTTAMEQFLSRKREVQELGRPQGPDTAALLPYPKLYPLVSFCEKAGLGAEGGQCDTACGLSRTATWNRKTIKGSVLALWLPMSSSACTKRA